MRMPRSLGVVATAFLALGLGLGIGSAAFSSYFAPSGSSGGGAYALGTSQTVDSNAKTAPARANPAPAERGTVDGKRHWQDPKHHGDERRSDNRGRKKDSKAGAPGEAVRHGSGDNSTGRSPKSNVEAQQVSVFTPVGSGGGHMALSSHAQTPAAASSSHGNKNGTREAARPEATTKPVNIDARISVRTTGSSVGVTQSNTSRTTARTTATPSNTNWTNRDHDRNVWGAGDTHVSHSRHSSWTDRLSPSSATAEQVNVDGLIVVGAGGDGCGRVHQDNSANTHSSSRPDNPERGAGRWHASRPGPDH